MNKPSFGKSSDYATLDFNGGSFYYGYEIAHCSKCGDGCDIEGHEDFEVWCFEAEFNGQTIVIPFHKLGCDDMFNIVECLSIGIGWILAKYELKLK